MNTYIDGAKLMAKGQITIPPQIRELLGLNIGDRVAFLVNDGTVTIANSAVCALKLLQNDMAGEAEKAGIFDENDVQKLIDGER